MGALTQKRSFLVTCTNFRFDFHAGWKNQNKHSTLNSSIDALSKWHEPDISSVINVGYFRYKNVFSTKFDLLTNINLKKKIFKVARYCLYYVISVS